VHNNNYINIICDTLMAVLNTAVTVAN